MFEKASNTTDKYRVNANTTVTVKNVKVEGERGEIFYRSDVTVKHKVTGDEPLLFNSPEEIETFVGDIDFEDPQLSLLGKAES